MKTHVMKNRKNGMYACYTKLRNRTEESQWLIRFNNPDSTKEVGKAPEQYRYRR